MAKRETRFSNKVRGSYKTEGVILKRINFGEADRILTIYTKHYGKIRVLAKGVRKITSRRSGSVELFNQTILFLHQGKNLDILTEAQVICSFKSLRKDLKKVATAYYFVELVDKLTPEGQANQQVYRLLVQFLEKIATEDLNQITRVFEQSLLNELGFGIPEEVKRHPENLRDYIESIAEKKLTSRSIAQELD